MDFCDRIEVSRLKYPRTVLTRNERSVEAERCQARHEERRLVTLNERRITQYGAFFSANPKGYRCFLLLGVIARFCGAATL